MTKNIDVSQKLTLSIPEAAAVLSVSTKVAYQLARRADFPSFKISPSRIVVSRTGLEEWIQKQLKDNHYIKRYRGFGFRRHASTTNKDSY